MSPRAMTILRWSLLALLGLAAAVAVGIGAAALTSRQIGLGSEPIRADEALAPRSAAAEGDRRSNHDGDRSDDDSPTATTTESTTSHHDGDDDEDD